MKTSELIDAALDWAVQKCEGARKDIDFVWWTADHYTPSIDWAQGGPIIEREGIELTLRTGVSAADGEYHWVATRIEGSAVSEEVGPTPLIAAMRCYVASQLGDEVDVPDELIN